jgi:hypothetical protein
MNCFFTVRRIAFALAMLGILGIVGTVVANKPHDVPYKESTDGVITNIVPITATNPVGHMDFEAEGEATRMGRYTETGGHDFYADGSLFGTFESTAADGSTISGYYYGVFFPIDGGLFEFDVTAVWQVGTDRLEGITGSGDVVAILDPTTLKFHFDTDATWTLP